MDFDKAAFSPAGAGEMAFGFGPHLIRIPSALTGGRLGVFEAEIPAGEGPPFHIHDAEDEFFRILEGRFGFWCNDDYVELSEGGVIVAPRGSVHRFQNLGDAAGRLMVVVTPGGFEGFFAAVGEANPRTPQEIDAVAARFNMRFVPAPALAAA